MLVGEQPGNQEDLEGHPFVGPAGKVLDRALAAAGVDRKSTYVTNAVKHFKWTATTGKRRLHDKPRPAEVRACRPWLAAEIEAVTPKVIVCLGATAAFALMGSAFRVTKERGRALASSWAPWLVATVHPSAILRMQDADERHAAFDAFVDDLKVAVTKSKS